MALKANLEKVQSFEEAFQQIKQATGIDNIDELVQAFIDAEDQNFSLFNYVNELNNEVEKLEEQITEIRADIEKYKGQGGQNDRQRKKLLKDLEDRLASTEAKAEQYEAKAQKAAKTVAQLEQGIQSIFNKIGCDKSALSEMLGSTGVTESNMMQYLGTARQRGLLTTKGSSSSVQTSFCKSTSTPPQHRKKQNRLGSARAHRICSRRGQRRQRGRR